MGNKFTFYNVNTYVVHPPYTNGKVDEMIMGKTFTRYNVTNYVV